MMRLETKWKATAVTTVMWMASAAITGNALAQRAGGPPPAPPVGTAVTPADALQTTLGLAEFEVMAVVKAMPEDKYNFAPSQSLFASVQKTEFATVRTFLQQVTHVTQANYFFFAAWSGLKPDVDVKAIGDIKTKSEAIKALAASFAFAHKAVATITPENAWVAVKPIDGFSTRVTIVSFAAAHAYDHYGQMVEYLRMNGTVPPGSK